MTITEIIEHDDGSATIKFDLSDEEVKTLLSFALRELLINAAAKNLHHPTTST